MQKNREIIININGDFEDFVRTNLSLLEQAAIPKSYYEKIFLVLKNIPEVRMRTDIVPEVLLQLLTGESRYLATHIDLIGKFKDLIVFCVGMNGHPDALEWLLKNGIIQAPDEPDYDGYGSDSAMTIEDRLMILLVVSRNIPALAWASDRNLLRNTAQTALLFIQEDWLDGFIWFNKRFPEVLFGKSTIMPWYYEKIFKVFRTDFNYALSIISSRQCFEWLTGDLSLYKTADYEEAMVWCGIQSGNMDVIEWLLKHRFIILPAKDQKIQDGTIAVQIKDQSYTGYNTTRLQMAVAYSGNISVLAWAYDNNLIEKWLFVFSCIAGAGWLEGFLWILDRFPSVISRELDYNLTNFFSFADKDNKYRAIHIFASLESSIPFLEWYRKNKPAQLHFRDSSGRTLLHLAAAWENIPVLQWCLENVPLLSGCNDNQWDETIVHKGASQGNYEIVRLALSHDRSLAFSEDKRGANMAVYALHSLDASFFNKILALTENPFRLENIHGIHMGKHMSDVLTTLNRALDTNYQLNQISVDRKSYEENRELCVAIKEKLDRNGICRILMLLLKGLKDETSSFFIFSKDIFGLFCRTVIDSYRTSSIASIHSPDGFFYRKREKDMYEQNAALTVFENIPK